MKRVSSCAVSLLLLGLIAGCGDYAAKRQAIADEAGGSIGEITKILQTITDEASAKDANPKIKALGVKLQDLDKRMNALPAPTKEEQARLKKHIEDSMKKDMEKYLAEMMRVSMIPGAGEQLADAFSEFEKMAKK